MCYYPTLRILEITTAADFSGVFAIKSDHIIHFASVVAV